MSKQNLLQAGRASYDGPTSHRAIIRQIHENCDKEMSYAYIERVVGLFFSSKGIAKLMKQGINFRVPLLGSFYITKVELRKRERIRIAKIKRRKAQLSRNMNVYYKKLRKRSKWEKVNKKRAEIGMEPLDFDTFMIISRKR